MNALTTRAQAQPMAALVPTNINEALQLAEMMSQGRLVPKHLQNSPGDCLLVVDQAMRWNMSPLAVAQKTSVIQGKLMYEGQLVAAAVETSGAIIGWMDYEYEGEGDSRAIVASATRRGESQPKTVRVTLKDARTGNDMWKKQPDQQLVYHSARVWARRWTPSVILGVYVPEEFDPDKRPEPKTVQGTVVKSEPKKPASPMNRMSSADLDAATDSDTIPALDPEPERPKPSLLDAGVAMPNQPADEAAIYASKLVRKFRECQVIEDYNEIIGNPTVAKNLAAMAEKRPELWNQVDEARQIALDALAEQADVHYAEQDANA